MSPSICEPVLATPGCRLGARDTEAKRMPAARAGVGDAGAVSTCAVTHDAVRKARQGIRRLRREHPGARIGAAGRAAQVEPGTFAAVPEASLALGHAGKLGPEPWARLAPDVVGATGRVVDDVMSVRETAPHLIDGFGSPARAVVQVQTGCDHRCTFGIIPFGRGNLRSVPAGVAVDRIRRHHNRDVLEVALTCRGADLPGQPRHGALVAQVLRHGPRLARLRVRSNGSGEAEPGSRRPWPRSPA